jgi:hypothetical protein
VSVLGAAGDGAVVVVVAEVEVGWGGDGLAAAPAVDGLAGLDAGCELGSALFVGAGVFDGDAFDFDVEGLEVADGGGDAEGFEGCADLVEGDGEGEVVAHQWPRRFLVLAAFLAMRLRSVWVLPALAIFAARALPMRFFSAS